jgi:hypothetical protein
MVDRDVMMSSEDAEESVYREHCLFDTPTPDHSLTPHNPNTLRTEFRL